MKCQKCGKNLPDDAFYCYVCGSKVKPDTYEEESSVTNKQEEQNPRTSIENEDISNENSSTKIEDNTCNNTTSAKESNPNEDSSKHTEQSSETTPELKTQKSSMIYWIAGIIFVIGLIIKGCNAALVRDNQKRLLNYTEKNYGSIQNMVFQDSGSNNTSPSNAVNTDQKPLSDNTKPKKGKTFQRRRLQYLHNDLVANYKFPITSYSDFEKKMEDENFRKNFQQQLVKNCPKIKIGDNSFETFEIELGYKERTALPIPNCAKPKDPNSYNYKQAHKNDVQATVQPSKKHRNSVSEEGRGLKQENQTSVQIHPELPNFIAEINKLLPVKINDEVKVKSLFIKDGFLVYDYTFAEISSYISTLNLNNTKETIRLGLFKKENLPLLELVASSNLGLKGRYTGAKSGDIRVVKCSATEVKQWLKELKRNPSDNSLEFLKESVVATANSCPMIVNEITTLTNCTYLNNTIYYNYTINENIVSMEEMIADKSAVRTELLQSLKHPTDLSLKNILSLCKKTNTSLIFVYKGNTSGKSTSFRFNANEL